MVCAVAGGPLGVRGNGLEVVVIDGLTADPGLDAPALALVPSGELTGEPAPGSAPVAVAFSAGVYTVLPGLAPGVYRVTADGAGDVDVIAVPAPAIVRADAAPLCRSAESQTVSLVAGRLWRPTGGAVRLTSPGGDLAAVASACTPGPVRGTERCDALEVVVPTTGLPELTTLTLAGPCPGGFVDFTAIDGPQIQQLTPAQVPSGAETSVRARIDDIAGEVREAAIRPTGVGGAFTVIPSTSLPGGGIDNERVAMTVPAGLTPGLYDVRFRDDQCVTLRREMLLVLP